VATHFAALAGAKVTTTYLLASAPSDFTAASFVSFAEVDLNVTAWVPSFSPALIVMEPGSTPSSFANASRTCF
jgi:hypothetical protein